MMLLDQTADERQQLAPLCRGEGAALLRSERATSGSVRRTVSPSQAR